MLHITPKFGTLDRLVRDQVMCNFFLDVYHSNILQIVYQYMLKMEGKNDSISCTISDVPTLQQLCLMTLDLFCLQWEGDGRVPN
jgi:hypothetical protein